MCVCGKQRNETHRAGPASLPSHMAMMSYTGSGNVSSAKHVIVDARTPSMLTFSP
mgnify:CR=1 FL=1